NHNRDEDRPEPHHDVIAVVEQRNVLRPQILRKRVETLHVRIPAPVSKEAQHFGYDNWIVDFPLSHIWLADDHQWRSLLAGKQRFHRCECDWLMPGDHLPLPVARGIQLQDAEDAASDNAHFHEYASLRLVPAGKQIE